MSFLNQLIGSLADISQNPVALSIFGIITILIILLLLATTFPFWRRLLVTIKILEEDERPSSLLLWVIAIVVIVKLTQIFIIQPFIVDGGSMLQTFHNKEFLLVDKLSYRLTKPARGDIMIFKLYEDPTNPYNGKHLIKRVIGLPGERIVVHNGETTIYNENYPEGFILNEEYVVYKDMTKNVDTTLNDHSYFMMGDNRAQSYDSRDWGPLDETNIRGQVLFRIYPFASASYEPGQFLYTN